MDANLSSNNNNNTEAAVRKHKFKPKARPVKQIKTEVKTEVVETADSAQAMDLLRRFNETQVALKTKPKVEKKVAASQIAFGYGGASASIKSFGVHKGSSSNRGDLGSALNGGTYASGVIEEKEYKEPWDYYSYYPVTLPLRRPYSGNPELLDEEEFGEASETINYDERSVNPAVDLGLTEENPEPSMFFLQLPPSMPMKKRSATADGQEAIDRLKSHGGARTTELPAGFMGKLVVYRSGVVKLKLGDTLYDVAAGLDSTFAQDVAAINTADKNCCIVGELNKRAILTPDMDSILQSLADL